MKIFNGRNRILMVSITEFLDKVEQSGRILERSISQYLMNDETRFALSVELIRDVEHEADEILKQVKHDIYAFLLIPDTRSDVDRLMNRLDDFIDDTKQLITLLALEKPHFPDLVTNDFKGISARTCRSCSVLKSVANTYFTHPNEVQNLVPEVIRLEKEVDTIQERVTGELFTAIEDLSLAQKMHVTRFLDLLSSLSDICEEVAKDLAISALKRSV